MLLVRQDGLPASLPVAGAVYGVLWWVLGPPLITPAVPGMSGTVFTIDPAALWSLVGHVLFGVVAAAVPVGLRRRRGGA